MKRLWILGLITIFSPCLFGYTQTQGDVTWVFGEKTRSGRHASFILGCEDVLGDHFERRAVYGKCPSVLTLPTSVGYNDPYYSYVEFNEIRHWINGPVVEIGSRAFLDFDKLVNVTIPSSITNVGVYAFSGCLSLSAVNIPDTMLQIGNYAFENCGKLNSLTIPPSVTKFGHLMCTGCDSLTCVNVDETQYLYEDGLLYRKDGGVPVECLKDTEQMTIRSGVRSIPSSVFSGAKRLQNIRIPNGGGRCRSVCIRQLHELV